MTNHRPLEGIRVLDIATFVAAPFAAATLAEFGAEVIKIEHPTMGDSLRTLGTPTGHGGTYWWKTEARNKKCITLDLKKGGDLFRKMAAQADVVMENFRPGTLEKWGIGYETLQKENPGLVMLRVSAYGQTGPKKGEPGFARVAHAFSGLTHLVGMPDGPPLVPGSTTLADYLTGLYGALGVLVALRERDRTGEGQVVDIGLYEGVFRLLDELAPVYEKTGFVRGRTGAETDVAAPHSHFPTADAKWVAISCTNDKMWGRMAEVMGRSDLATPETFGQKDKRVAARHEVNALVAEWSKELSCEKVLSECAKGEVPCGQVNTIADIFADPHFQARENIVSVPDDDLGSLKVPAVVPRLTKTPGKIDHLGRSLGADNKEIYAQWLGLTTKELEALKAEGVI